MVGMLDTLNSFNYGGVGATATPGLMGAGMSGMAGMGASNPMASAVQGMNQNGGLAGSSSGPGSIQGPNVTPPIGWNMDTMKMLFGGLQSLGNIWMAWQANKLAKDQFNFNKNVTNTNLANQVSAYNTTLEDRIRSRAVTEGQTPEQAQQYINDHKLEKRTL